MNIIQFRTKMWVLSLLCLLSISAALPAPRSSELEASKIRALTKIQEGSSEEAKESSAEAGIGGKEIDSEEPKEGSLEAAEEGSPEAAENSVEEKREELEEPLKPIIEIPEPPQLEPIDPPVIIEVGGAELPEEKPESSEDKEKESGEEQKNESGEDNKEEKEDIEPEDEKPVIVNLEVQKPSFWASIFTWPPSLSNFQLPSFSWLPLFGKGRVVYPPIYDPKVPNQMMYVYVK